MKVKTKELLTEIENTDNEIFRWSVIFGAALGIFQGSIIGAIFYCTNENYSYVPMALFILTMVVSGLILAESFKLRKQYVIKSKELINTILLELKHE